MSHQALVEKINKPGSVFKIGDHAFTEKADARKLEERWEGPFEILKVGKASVTLKYYGTPKKFHPSRLKPSKITPKDLTAEPIEIEQDPDPNMDPRDLIGKRVRVWWPSLKQWYSGTVTSRKKKRHLVQYDERSKNTPEGEDEAYFENLLGAKKTAKWKLLIPKIASA